MKVDYVLWYLFMGFHWGFAAYSFNVLSKYALLSFTNITWENPASVTSALCVCLLICLLKSKVVRLWRWKLVEVTQTQVYILQYKSSFLFFLTVTKRNIGDNNCRYFSFQPLKTVSMVLYYVRQLINV